MTEAALSLPEGSEGNRTFGGKRLFARLRTRTRGTAGDPPAELDLIGLPQRLQLHGWSPNRTAASRARTKAVKSVKLTAGWLARARVRTIALGGGNYCRFRKIWPASRSIRSRCALITISSSGCRRK
jgi:hypothetical protein